MQANIGKMPEDFYDKVKDRAHKIWLEEGKPEGREEAHWLRAESEVSSFYAKSKESASKAAKKTAEEVVGKAQTAPKAEPAKAVGSEPKTACCEVAPKVSAPVEAPVQEANKAPEKKGSSKKKSVGPKSKK